MKIDIVVASTYPYLTGPAFSALYHALYLHQYHPTRCDVILHVPWINDVNEQKKVYGQQHTQFNSKEEQISAIQQYIRCDTLKIRMYDSFVLMNTDSIFPVASIDQFVRQDTDCLLLEEPEHLTAGLVWHIIPYKFKYKQVIGIIHTNTESYIPLLKPFSLIPTLVNYHCHRTIAICEALQYDKNWFCMNVIPVRPQILVDATLLTRKKMKYVTTNQCYFIGKLIWEKGFDYLFDLMSKFEQSQPLVIDLFGKGKNESEIKTKSLQSHISRHVHLNFKGTIMSQNMVNTLAPYKIFINVSQSEGVCTTTIEALCMNKFVIIPKHPSNTIFYQFRNCYAFDSDQSFIQHLSYCLKNEPVVDSEQTKLLFDTFSYEKIGERLLFFITQR